MTKKSELVPPVQTNWNVFVNCSLSSIKHLFPPISIPNLSHQKILQLLSKAIKTFSFQFFSLIHGSDNTINTTVLKVMKDKWKWNRMECS